MKVVVLANLRWVVYSPAWLRLAHEGTPVDLVYNGKQWYLTNGTNTILVPDRDTGAMMLAKQLNAIRAHGA